eukprot:jgi/Chrpa1/25641/Chrysochromulina_OHIO_Genome00024027-RA
MPASFVEESAKVFLDVMTLAAEEESAPGAAAAQLYGTANEDVEEESEIDEAVRCAPFWQATQQ